MASTALITFLLETRETVGSVELFGSWDNFRKPYPMEKDSKVSAGHWRGCHSFRDIICDGGVVIEGKRNGCLRMGGTYWYYYRLDDELEFYNPIEPSTTTCPFLPGQLVNILEVPVLVEPLDAIQNLESRSCSSLTHFTLNPEDRFLAPRPPSLSSDISRFLEAPSWPAEIQHIQGDSRPETLGGLRISKTLQNSPLPLPYSTSSQRPNFTDWRSELSSRHASSPRSTCEIKRSRSASSRPRANHSRKSSDFLDLAWTIPPGITVSQGQSRPPDHRLSSDPTFSDVQDIFLNETRLINPPNEYDSNSIGDHPEMHGKPITEWSTYSLSYESFTDSFVDPNSAKTESTLLRDQKASGYYMGKSSWLSLDDDQDTQDSALENEFGARLNEEHEVQYYSSSSEACNQRGICTLGEFGLEPNKLISSNRTSGIFSATSTNTGYTGCMTPSYYSQPLTPTMSEFGGLTLNSHHADMSTLEEADEFSDYYLDGGFEGYNLPENEHASALTLRNLTNATSKSSLRESSSTNEKSGKKFVERWIDGSKSNKTALEELVDDLGYLGTMIA